MLLFAVITVGRLFAQQSSPESPAPASSSSESAPVRHVTISWQKITGAIHYEVLIRPLGGDVTIDRKTDATSVVEVLPPGTYQVRVVSFNIFDKPATLSPWRTLEVVRVYKPEVDRLIPKVFYSGLASESLIVEGKFFLPETTVDLMRDGKVVAHGRIDKVRDVQLGMHFDLAEVPPGSYDLRLTNPENLVLVMKGAIEVRNRIQPLLTSISLSHGYNDRVYRGVAVSGGGFSNDTSFFLEKGRTRIDIPSVIVRSESRAVMDIDLGSAAPGEYRLVAANPGGLQAQIEGAVTVENITTPKFVSMSPKIFTIGRDSGLFKLTALHMIPEAQVYLQKGDTLIPTQSFAGGSSAGATRDFRIDLRTVAPGTYALLIQNSQLLTALVPDVVTIKPRPIPSLTHSSLTRAFNTLAYRNVVLRGQNLLPAYRVVLKRGTVQHDLVTRYVSSGQLDVDADFRGMAPGNYEVLVQNSGRVVASLPGGITVVVPPHRYVHPTSYKLLIGYPYQLVLTQSFADTVASSYAGGDFIAAFPVGVKFFPKTPGVRDMGLEIELGYSQFVDTSSGASSRASLGITKTGFNLYYRTPFKFPLNGIARLGYGITLSGYSVPTLSGTSTGSSFDFYYDLGLGGELDVGKTLAFEAGVTWTRILYATVNLDSLAFVVRGGVRLGG